MDLRVGLKGFRNGKGYLEGMVVNGNAVPPRVAMPAYKTKLLYSGNCIFHCLECAIGFVKCGKCFDIFLHPRQERC